MARMGRPRLPMMLGLAVLTTAAHFLMAALHLLHHADLAEWAMSGLFALGPFVGVGLMLRGRGRHGAALLVLTYLAAAWYTLYAHIWLADDLLSTRFYAGVVQMMLAFELQGFCAGIILFVKPEAPRSVDAGAAG